MAQIFMQDPKSWPDHACRSQNGGTMAHLGQAVSGVDSTY